MGLNIKSKDGKKGYFDAAAFLQSQVPDASITGYDKSTGQIKFKSGDKEGSFDARSMLADQGASIESVGEFNRPEQAVDSSPLTWKERFELGYLTRESSDYQRLVGNISSMFGGKGADDASIEANEKRAIAKLKSRYDDAKVVNGELVVKHDGVWKRVDSSSDSIGEDAAQLLGNTGLNIMGSIAGGLAGGAVAGPPGAILGAIAGGLTGEVAEEATAIGIAGGEVDPEGVARDLMTEGVLAMAGETVFGLLGRGAAKLTKMAPEVAANLAKAEAVKTEAAVVKGMQKVGSTADAKVKDLIAQTYSTVNSELSEVPLREAIDNPANMAKAHQYSKVARALPTDAPNPLLREMADGLQDAVETSMSKAQAKFGEVLGQIRNKVSDDFTIDLEQRALDLKVAAQEAPRDKRAFFNSLENETTDLIKAMKSRNEQPVLRGKSAFALTERQYEMINKKLADVGAYDRMATPGSEDRLMIKSMEKIKSYIDSERLFAAEHANLQGPFAEVKKMYGSVKDAVDVIWSKSFSNKRDLSFAQKVAQGKVEPNVTEALAELNRLVPEAKVQSKLSEMRLRQAGIEMTKLFKMPDLVRTAGAGTAAVTGGAPGMAAAATVASPRFAAAQARGAARVSEAMTKGALAKALPKARAQARALMGMAYSSGFLRTVDQAATRSLLQNPDLFKQYLDQVNNLSSSMANASEEKVTEAAIQAAGQ